MFDLFICHATEDKDSVARPLAQRLSNLGLNIWYDEFSLKLGDSLRESIDRGLAESRYGIVVLSPRFFAKRWPQAELDGLFAKEMAGTKTILPIWHEMTHDDILRHSPLIADKKAAKTAEGLDHVVDQILGVVEPDLSHKTQEGLTLSVTPTSLRLHTGDWSVKTSVRVSNRTDVELFSVFVKIAVETGAINSESIQIEAGSQTTALQGVFGRRALSADLLIFDLIDANGHEAVLLRFHSIEARQTREFIVWGTSQIPSTAQVRVSSFSQQPDEVLEQPQKVAVPFRAPESGQLKGFRFLLLR